MREQSCSDCGVAFDEEFYRTDWRTKVNGGHNPGCERVTKYNQAVADLRAVFND